MGLYDDVSYRLRSHCDEIFPFQAFTVLRDWSKIDEFLSKIPYECDRLLTTEEVLSFYD